MAQRDPEREPERERERQTRRAPRIPRLRPSPEFALKVPVWAPLAAAALFVVGLGAFLSPKPASSPPAAAPAFTTRYEAPPPGAERVPLPEPRETHLWQAPERQPAWTSAPDQPGGMEAGSLGWGAAESAPAPAPTPAPKPGPAWPHLRRVANLAGITAPAEGVGERLQALAVENKRVIEARPLAPGEKPLPVKRPKCAPGAYRLPPCAWKVEGRGGACINEQGVVTTQEGPSGKELPALKQGRVIPYAYSAEGLGCEP